MLQDTGVGKSEFVEKDLISLIIILKLRKKVYNSSGILINTVSTHHLKYISNVGLGIFLRKVVYYISIYISICCD